MPDESAGAELSSTRTAGPVTPLRVFLLVVGLVFAVEAVIMLAIYLWVPAGSDSVLVSFIDTSLLTSVLAPAIWILVARPLRTLVAQRGVLLSRLLDAQESERTRIAHDLHDELGQQLTALLLNIRAIERAGTLEDRQQHVVAARSIASRSLESVRRMARGLAPVVLHDLGLAAAVERLCEDVQLASGLDLRCDLTLPKGRLPTNVGLAAYRVIQESLTNVTRHAAATRVWVQVKRAGRGLNVLVEDDGCGIGGKPRDWRAGGTGIQGMRERIELVRGTLRIEPRPGGGTIVSALIPEVFESHESNSNPDR